MIVGGSSDVNGCRWGGWNGDIQSPFFMRGMGGRQRCRLENSGRFFDPNAAIFRSVDCGRHNGGHIQTENEGKNA